LENSITINKPTPNIEELYVSSSIFLLASRAEGFGLVLAEAMACGLPCISFDCPNGPRDIINNGSTGWLIPDGDIYRYVEALRQLSLDIHLRKEFGFQGKIRAKKFESSLICNQFLHLLKDKFQ
jgi:glycosyltransferase involved in cell wall biosynthesis